MQVIVNGESHTIEADSTVADLVASLASGGAPCAVEVNRAVVPRAEHARTSLDEGDEIEIVTLVGGG
ncbi:MAG: sulfur carrier protein ThiS [Phycisphaerales bacterium]|nr:sulfur carrier protein ThiS [Phycisphaerales bacterium]